MSGLSSMLHQGTKAGGAQGAFGGASMTGTMGAESAKAVRKR